MVTAADSFMERFRKIKSDMQLTEREMAKQAAHQLPFKR